MEPKNIKDRRVVVIGAGPPGLTAGVELCKLGMPPLVVERDSLVGGIARTEQYKGYYFDIGGHRFFTKIGEVESYWKGMLGTEFITRPRISRIYYKGKFFDYPLRAMNALANLGLWTSAAVVYSYIRSRLFPYPKEETLEEWVSNRFGRKSYSIFFKTYTEQVWAFPVRRSGPNGRPSASRGCRSRSPCGTRSSGSFPFCKSKGDVVKTLIDEFQHPRLGPGMMWTASADYIKKHGGDVRVSVGAVRLRHAGGRVLEVVLADPATIGLIKMTEVFDGTVVRQKKAYPVYNSTHGGFLEGIQKHLAGFANRQTVGRNGLHKYSNQDHSMRTAMLAVRNVAGERHDVWNVNTERSYHEEVGISKDGSRA